MALYIINVVLGVLNLLLWTENDSPLNLFAGTLCVTVGVVGLAIT